MSIELASRRPGGRFFSSAEPIFIWEILSSLFFCKRGFIIVRRYTRKFHLSIEMKLFRNLLEEGPVDDENDVS